jgi:spoIIIJ-associated protein
VYDAKNEAHEFMGAGRDEAVEKASEFFGIPQGDLVIYSMPAGEVYGCGGRSVVVAVPRDRKPPDPSGSRGGGRREGRSQGRSEGRSDGRRGGRRDGREDRGRGRGERSRSAAPLQEEPQGPSVGTARGELGELGSFLLGLIERLDHGPFEISENEEEGLVVIQVNGPAAAILAGGDGRPVDAIQLLANQVAVSASDDPPRVVIDVEGDAEARAERMGSLAQRAATRARDSGRAVALDAMNPKDRRAIHLALRDDQGIATMSMGEGRYRQVVVVPEGAPEFDDALRESEAAATRSDA